MAVSGLKKMNSVLADIGMAGRTDNGRAETASLGGCAPGEARKWLVAGVSLAGSPVLLLPTGPNLDVPASVFWGGAEYLPSADSQ